MTLQDRVERFLLRGKATASNLALALGRRQYDIQAVLNRMESAGQAFRCRGEVWSLYVADTEKQEPCIPATPDRTDKVAAKNRPKQKGKSGKTTQK